MAPRNGSTVMQKALQHARLMGGDEEQSRNLLFRNGPCDVCGGGCFSRSSNRRLTTRLLAGKKPVGTYACRSKWRSEALAKLLTTRGLSTWRGKNRWGMHVVVASAMSDKVLAGAGGTPRELAFTSNFIDEQLPLPVMGALYGYPSCGLY